MRGIKLIARSWVKNPIQDILWMVSRQNNLHVTIKPHEDHIKAFCGEDELDKFKEIAHKFCLICEPMLA